MDVRTAYADHGGAVMAPHFDNRFLRQLPVDTQTAALPRQVYGAACSRVAATPVRAPRLLAWSSAMAEVLGLERPSSDDDPWVQALAGNRLLPGMDSYAMCYGGHQFGNWAGQLGDGRALGLGEWVAPDGQHWEMQLKGAGMTPYSRGADGRAVLRSSLREYLCSEAMHALGVPTTRALSLIATGEEVVRDMFYDGHPEAEPGAIVCRVAPSFLRFGSFELPASRGDTGLLQALIEYTVRTHDPAFASADAIDIAGWYREVCARTARLMVAWMRVGFVHGVMNTDNMSIHGLTIDYGPYGWLEPYDLDFTPNTTDAQGRRYAFGRQPGIAQWNLAALGQALTHAGVAVDVLQQSLNHYGEVFHAEYGRVFADKLGLHSLTHDDPLLLDLFRCMARHETDYCLSFRQLADLPLAQAPEGEALQHYLDVMAPAFYTTQAQQGESRDAWQAWFKDYRARVEQDAGDAAARQARMQAVNPLYVPRNYLAHQAIEAMNAGDAEPLTRLQQVLSKPYEAQPGCEAYAQRRPDWARDKAGCSALSCSS